MKVSTENSQIRRKSSFTTIWLFVPYVNFIFFLLQMRGAYHALRNHYYFRKQMPNEATALFIALKFTLYGVLASSLVFLALLSVGLNPFGHTAAWYLNEMITIIGPLLPVQVVNSLLAVPSAQLQFAGFNLASITALLGFLGFTYFIFGLAGAFLSLANLRADLKRNQFLT
ncbi:MAG: hypothetical protein KDK38_15825 [Leptospiraceae bacterium]|nr:hypothetical protein [Leptospiraceae bacterium]